MPRTVVGADGGEAPVPEPPYRLVPRPQMGSEAEDDLGRSRVEVPLRRDLRPCWVPGHAELLGRLDDERPRRSRRGGGNAATNGEQQQCQRGSAHAESMATLRYAGPGPWRSS